jgi:hypothetical protein
MISIQQTARAACVLAGLTLAACGTLLGLDDYRVASAPAPDCSGGDAGSGLAAQGAEQSGCALQGGQCSNDDRGCEGDNLLVCEQGSFVVRMSCALGCAGGRCKECNEEGRCVDGAAEACVGGFWQSAGACSAECERGVCVDSCTEGRTQCDGLVLQRCSSKGYVPERTCEQACLTGADGDACAECRPSDTSCVTSIPRTCSPEGRWINGAECTGDLPVCVPETGKCACEEGVSACVGNDAERRCIGGQFVQSACAANSTCRDDDDHCRAEEWDFLVQLSAGPFGGTKGVSVDTAGNVFVVGASGTITGGDAPDEPVVQEFEVFARKYNGAGLDAPLWSREVDEAGRDDGNAIAVDAAGNVVIVGTTGGEVSGTSFGSTDFFVRKYNNGGTLVWSEQFGSSGGDQALAVALDGSGNVFVAGDTSGEFLGQTSAGDVDAFVMKLSPFGVEQWTHQFGTAEIDSAFAVAVDANGDALVAGSVRLGGALEGQISAGSTDAFVRKYGAAGSAVPLWTRQFGTAQSDEAVAVAVDASGNVFVGGRVSSGGALTEAPSLGGGDAFVIEYDPDGSEPPLWIEQFGTSARDELSALSVDGRGQLYVAGNTRGTFAGQTAFGSDDGFALRFDPSGEVGWVRQFGTPDDDRVSAMVVDAAGSVLVTGGTTLADEDRSFLRKLVE